MYADAYSERRIYARGKRQDLRPQPQSVIPTGFFCENGTLSKSFETVGSNQMEERIRRSGCDQRELPDDSATNLIRAPFIKSSGSAAHTLTYF